MRQPSLPAFVIASTTGFTVWALSPWLTGYKEAWDAPGVYYYVALLLAGTLSGLVTAKPLWAHYTGSMVGQLVYVLVFLPLGPLAAVGLLFLILWSLIFMCGAYLGARMHTFVIDG